MRPILGTVASSTEKNLSWLSLPRALTRQANVLQPAANRSLRRTLNAVKGRDDVQSRAKVVAAWGLGAPDRWLLVFDLGRLLPESSSKAF